MSHVFISYKHDNGDFAEILANRIKEAGFSVWIDEDDDKLPAGANWRDTIDRAIKDAFALIVVITPRAKASEYIIYECGFAYGASIQVVPIMLEPTQIHPRLDVLQYLDFTNPNRSTRPWQALIEELKKLAAAYQERESSCAKDMSSLIDALHDINKEASNHTIKTLARIGMPSVGYLLKALHHTNVRVRRSAAIALGEIKEEVAVPGLLEALYDTDELVRDCAISALGTIGVPSVPGLLKVLIDHNCHEKVRAEVALALGLVGGFEAVCGLLETLKNDKAKIVRTQTAFALGQIGHTHAVNGLFEALLSDNDGEVRIQTALSLEQIGHSDVISGLRNALITEKQAEIRDTIFQVIERLEKDMLTS